MFDASGHTPARRAKKIDGRVASLAVRDLERGEGVGLPSGEAVAQALGERPLTSDEIGVAATGWRGLLAHDATSVLHAPADWRPRAGLVDLLTLAEPVA
jgi:hypothetical protein